MGSCSLSSTDGPGGSDRRPKGRGLVQEREHGGGKHHLGVRTARARCCRGTAEGQEGEKVKDVCEESWLFYRYTGEGIHLPKIHPGPRDGHRTQFP